jgi:hypothetical protein
MIVSCGMVLTAVYCLAAVAVAIFIATLGLVLVSTREFRRTIERSIRDR